MTKYVLSDRLPDFAVRKNLTEKRRPFSFDLELTARCNHNCKHCYINLPPNDLEFAENELSLSEINDIVDQGVSMGALWCLLTGGEPLLRRDFFEIYIDLKKKGLLVSVFTNACLINEEHIKLFKEYPPRDIEVTVYGVTEETYEKVTRRKGSYEAFRRGLDLLMNNGIKVRLKAMALRSNVHELSDIFEFSRKFTSDYFRFDPFLIMRHDGDPLRNEEISSERLSPSEIVTIENNDDDRVKLLENNCDQLIVPGFADIDDDHLFHCGAGNLSFTVSYDGTFRLCSSLWAPGTTVNLREVSLREAWESFVPQVRDLRTDDEDYLHTCGQCPIVNLCLNCPAHAYLETGRMDSLVPYFCEVAHARAEALAATLNHKTEEA